MKKLWNYIFYFTWMLHVSIAKILFEKPLDYLFSLHLFLDQHNKNGKKSYKNVINNREYGFNIGFAYNCMLTTTAVILSIIEISIFFSFNTSLSQISSNLFNIKLNDDVNAIAFFSSIIAISFLLNELFLGWFRDGYIKYFKEFEKIKDDRKGYFTALIFHLGAAIFLAISIIYFDV